MEFNEIVVKESPGLCRCCLSEGCYKDLGSEYTWMNEAEVYADMLLECFDISITQHNEGPNGPSRLICEVCITRLRDACNFKKQVLDSEKKFIDMLGRGEFRPKVLIYQTQMKTENSDEQVQEEVEYLEDDLDFDDDEVLKPSVDEHSSSPLETVTSETISLKRKLKTKKTKISRPKKHVEVDEKPKSSKAVSKGMRKLEITEEIRSDQLLNIRHNVLLVLQYGTVVPFQWTTKGFRCFYCSKPMKDCEVVKEHTVKKHANIDLVDFIPKKIITKDVPIKVDVSNVSCKACDETISNIDDLIEHIQIIHEEIYDTNVEKCFLPFLLNRDAFDCVICECKYDNFTSMINHMHKSHVYHSVICQECGLSFINKARLMRHMKNSHKDHKCNICLKLFDAVHKLEKHKERIHGKAKSFQCDLCCECFESGYQFKVHMGKVHNVEKYRIKCELCPKICTTKGAMLLHVQSVHSEMKFKCDSCEYETGIKWMITLHKKKHTGVRDYVCSVCDKQFRRSSNLRAHMKVHSGASGRVCRVCRKGFLDADTLSQHEMELHYYNKY